MNPPYRTRKLFPEPVHAWQPGCRIYLLTRPECLLFPHEISVQATMAEAGEDVIQEEVEGPNAWGARGLNLLGALSGRTMWQGGRKSAAVAIRHGFVSGGEGGTWFPDLRHYCLSVLLGAWAASLLQRLVVDGRRRRVEDDPRW
jgi:hypothetical protein